jgi:hypothetical protein
MSEELRIDPSSEGVIIGDLIPGSPAQSYGFQRGDIVLQVNNQRITKTRDLERATSQQNRIWRVTSSLDLDFARFRQLSLSIGRFFLTTAGGSIPAIPKGPSRFFLSDKRVDEHARPVERRSQTHENFVHL